MQYLLHGRFLIEVFAHCYTHPARGKKLLDLLIILMNYADLLL